MSFLTALGKDAKAVFSFLTSTKGQALVTEGEAVVEAIEPGTAGLFTIANNWMTEIIKAQALGEAAGATATGGTAKASIVISTVEPQILAWAKASGYVVPDAAEIQTASNALVNFLNAFGATPSGTTTVTVPNSSVIAPATTVTGVATNSIAPAPTTGGVVTK
jgi:hypothetical protein